MDGAIMQHSEIPKTSQLERIVRIEHVLNSRFMPYIEQKLKQFTACKKDVAVRLEVWGEYIRVCFKLPSIRDVESRMKCLDEIYRYMLYQFTDDIRAFYFDTEFGHHMVKSLCETYPTYTDDTARKVILAEKPPVVRVKANHHAKCPVDYVWTVTPRVS